jgi:hypothetical protein
VLNFKLIIMKNSKFMQLNAKDFVRGLLIAMLTGALTALYEVVKSGTSEIHWDKIGLAALASGIAYLIKSLATNSRDELFAIE